MKPKLWGAGSRIAQIEGEARVRGLNQVRPPFLSVEGPGFRSGKQARLTEVFTEGAVPYLYSNYLTDRGYVSVSGNQKKKLRWTTPFASFVPNILLVTPSEMVHVGEGLIAQIVTVASGPSLNLLTPHYGVLTLTYTKYRTSTVAAESDPLEEKTGRGVMFDRYTLFCDPAAPPSTVGGYYRNAMNVEAYLRGFSIWASGYDGAEGGRQAYRFGWRFHVHRLANIHYDPEGEPRYYMQSVEPVNLLGDTETLLVDPAESVYFPRRNNLRAPVFCAGPGVLMSMLIKEDRWPVAVTWKGNSEDGYDVDKELFEMAAPVYLAVSTDHGETWAAEPQAEMTALIPTVTPLDDERLSRPVRWGEAERRMAAYSSIHYVGSGVNLIVLQGWAPSIPATSDEYRTALFRRDATGLVTRLSWPLDAEHASIKLPAESAPRSCLIRAFGEGCLALTVDYYGAPRVMFTHDYGTTWQVSAAMPTKPLGVVPVVTRPFKSEEKPGEIIYVYPDNVTTNEGTPEESTKSGIFGFRTNGLFLEFEDIGRVIASSQNEEVEEVPDWVGNIGGTAAVYTGEVWGLNAGKQFKPYVNPAFPKEFDK